MNFYQFHIGDYIKQTVHLTPMEDICYRRLIDMYYETEQPIPTETDRVSRRLRLDTELVDSVLKEFFTLTANGWENARCNKEIDTYHVKADTARSNGMLGGRPKKTQPVSDRNLPETGSKANQEPRTTNQEPKGETPRKRSAPTPVLDCPEDVDQQTWADWQQLRKTKKAPVTETVLKGARQQAEKAGMTLTEFLAVWCRRGSQGLEADWLKPSERSTGNTESFRAQDQRAAESRAAELAPGVARRTTTKPMETPNVPALASH